MRVAIDGVGRLVVPKPLRDELGIGAATELEVVVRDGVLEATVADVPARVEERDGTPVIAGPEPAEPLTAADVRATIDRVRR
jgi:AbrB family looped-hinge helix DNA binding protein